MPQPQKLDKAVLTEIWWDTPGKPAVKKTHNAGDPKQFVVQFNPQTLKLNYSNQKAGGDQPGSSSMQFVGKGTTKLSMELWFDATLPQPDPALGQPNDVRTLTQQVSYFMTPQTVVVDGKEGLAPPGVRFQWGTFLFEGFVDSMDETLEFFSSDGRPLRASVSIGASQQEIVFNPPPSGPGGPPPAPGTKPLSMARQGDSVQQMAARAGQQDWKTVAERNGIENPRQVAAGALVNLTPRPRGR